MTRGARTSPAMKEARRLIEEEGYSGYKAAKATGISESAISKTKWRREQLAKKRAAAQN